MSSFLHHCFIGILVLVLISSRSATGADSTLSQISSTQLEVLEPVYSLFQPFLQILSIIVGGVFGLYLILIIIRIHYERKKVFLLEQIRSNLDRLNEHFAVPIPFSRKGFWRRWQDFWARTFQKGTETTERNSVKKRPYKNRQHQDNQ